MRRTLTLTGLLALAATAQAQPTSPDVTEREICSGRRQVAFLMPWAACTNVSGWQASPLIPGAELGSLPAGAQGYFARYCVYDFTGPGLPSANQVDALQNSVLGEVAPDCEAVAGMGSAVTDAVWPEVRARFRHGIGALDSLPATGASRTRVAVVDSSPFEFSPVRRGLANEGTSAHGFTMGRIVREIACPDPAGGACLGVVADHPALIILPDGTRDRYNGGYIGAFSDLVRALSATLDEHATVEAAVGPRRLIINLSLGWAPDLLPTEPALLGNLADPSLASPGPRAVFDMLQLASCQDHLVVAAAGNAINGPEAGDGPLLPGAWEQIALDPADCARFGLTRPAAIASYRPTLYSVGGVDSDDQPLINARSGAEPRQVVFASHGVAAAADAALPAGAAALMDGPTEVYTGSSVAAAVVSGAAAAAWAYRPGMAAADLMQQLWLGGTSLGRSADYCAGATLASACGLSPIGAGRQVRRIGVQAGLCGVCSAGAGLCPSPAALGCGVAPTSPAPVVIDEALLTLGAGPFGVPRDVADPAGCQPDDIYDHATAGSGEPCADRQFRSPNAAPRVGPQPFDPLCPTCGLVDITGASGVYVLKGGLNTVYSGYTFEDFTLKLDNGVVISLDSYLKAEGITGLTGGDTFYVSGIDLSTVSGFTQATVYATLVEKSVTYVIDSPVLVY